MFIYNMIFIMKNKKWRTWLTLKYAVREFYFLRHFQYTIDIAQLERSKERHEEDTDIN